MILIYSNINYKSTKDKRVLQSFLYFLSIFRYEKRIFDIDNLRILILEKIDVLIALNHFINIRNFILDKIKLIPDIELDLHFLITDNRFFDISK